MDLGAVEGAETGIPSESRWSLPNGYDCLAAPPEAAGLPGEVGDVDYLQFSPRPGLEVYTFAATIRSPVTLSYEVQTGDPYLWLALNFSGQNEYHHGSSSNGGVEADSFYCAMLRDPMTSFFYPPARHRAAGLAFTPQRLRDMLQGQSPGRVFESFLAGEFDPAIIASRPTALLRSLSEQICNHPYQGVMQALFLEAKAFEMLAEILRLLNDTDPPYDRGRGRRAALAAREIFMANLADPPRIVDVARQVGLSHRRLNEVFRDVFGASPLQCLVRWRLDLAQHLLATGGMSVKQVAHQIGYAHASNFSLAFTRRFGHPPTGAPDAEAAFERTIA
ncbi:helix-turn-helix transcriptional regulator [Segnochrobactrum spirostomi]|uniref:Helix-turn-helix transcriptional regulator n=1 Tax=Segnochrobactrum spirostomi TaxID=2608987 RepID=A0A6A7Y7K3_9HYPH|nr:AraC family transcriptional regulator [Segnochrobactrum spirostomi]MQT14685.1 helix-turn-helix transcriptional regulator [Segnochrobactrum spirostomi]